jgi:RNA polymerase sigma-70 factor (ECF subfamily)
MFVMSDDALIRGLREGNNQTLSYFIKRYRNMIKMEVGKYVWNYHDAEDVIMKTIEDVWSKIDLYRPLGYKLSTWVVTVARNNALDFRKKQKDAEWNNLFTMIPEYRANPEQELIYNDGVRVIDGIISGLKPKNRQMVLMRRDGYSFSEIAHEYKLSETGARTRTWRHQMAVMGKFEKACNYGLNNGLFT